MTPAERAQRIESYGRAYERLVAALERYPRPMWQWRPAPERWTIHEIVVHIADSEANSYIRCRRFLAEPGSQVLGYDENAWARELHYHEQDPAAAVELFRWLRGQSHALIQNLPDSAWSSTVYHSENGLTTMEDWLITYDRHVLDHIAQMDAVWADWQRAHGAG